MVADCFVVVFENYRATRAKRIYVPALPTVTRRRDLNLGRNICVDFDMQMHGGLDLVILDSTWDPY